MRTRFVILLSALLVIKCVSVNAQCSTTTVRISYDTTVTGTGSMYPPYRFSFPRFNGTHGTLVNVKIASVVSLNYSYSIENKELGGNKISRVRINRFDEISSQSLPVPLSNDHVSPQSTHILAGSDGTIGSGADYFYQPSVYLMNQDTIINEILHNTADFMGEDSVRFDYFSDVGSIVSGNFNVDVAGQAEDEITFTLTYTYCSNIVLASDITSFTASKKESEILFRWFTNNEKSGRKYELVESYDGKSYRTVHTLPASPKSNAGSSYQYTYRPDPTMKGKVIYRIRQVDPDGNSRYSVIRVVDLGMDEHKAGIKLLPNPSRGGAITVMLHPSERSDWDVEVFSVSGQIMAKKRYSNTLVARLSSDYKFARGMYIVRATNLKTSERFVERLIVE